MGDFAFNPPVHQVWSRHKNPQRASEEAANRQVDDKGYQYEAERENPVHAQSMARRLREGGYNTKIKKV